MAAEFLFLKIFLRVRPCRILKLKGTLEVRIDLGNTAWEMVTRKGYFEACEIKSYVMDHASAPFRNRSGLRRLPSR